MPVARRCAGYRADGDIDGLRLFNAAGELLATAPIGRVAEVLNSGRLEALAHVRATAGKQVAHALAFAPVEEIERATLSMLGTPAQPAALGRAAGAEGTRLSFRQATSRHETV